MLSRMGRWRRGSLISLRLLGGLAVAGCILGASSEAMGAKPGYTVFPPLRYRSFEVRGTHGFDAFISVDGDNRLEVVLFKLGTGSRVTYSVQASTPGHLVKARIGNLGRISMHFEPSGRFKPNREPEGDCQGREGLVQSGTFVGSFRLRGEGGFTRVTATRVPGIAVHTFRQVCKGADAGSQLASAPETRLEARHQSRRRVVGFRASARSSSPGRIEEFEAYVVESRPRIHIERHVSIGGEPGEFTFDTAAEAAVATPPTPFSGFAELRAQEGLKPTWRGNLETSFLGLGEVSLAGAGFHASLMELGGGIVSQD